jgi:hypothetical protein
LEFVEGHSHGVEAQRGRSIYQLIRGVVNVIDGIVGRVDMKIDFQHGCTPALRAQ